MAITASPDGKRIYEAQDLRVDTIDLLHKTFITPIDREQIHSLINTMDDVAELRGTTLVMSDTLDDDQRPLPRVDLVAGIEPTLIDPTDVARLKADTRLRDVIAPPPGKHRCRI